MPDDLRKFSEMESQFIDDCKKTGEQEKVTEDVIRSLLTLWVKFHDGHQGNTFKDANLCLESLLLCTGRIVFNTKYSKQISKNLKTDLKSKIEQCQGFLNTSKCQNVFNGIASMVENPWQSSAFNSVICSIKDSVLSSSEIAADNLWNTEGWAMLTCRVDYLAGILPNKLAADRFRQLVHIIVTKGRHHANLKTKTEDNALDPYIIPFEKYLEYLQVYAILVFQKKIEIKTIGSWDGELVLHVIAGLHEKSENPCSERLLSKFKEWNTDGLEAAKFLATVTTKEKLKFEDNCKLAEFYKKWAQLYEGRRTDEDATDTSLSAKTPFHQILESLEGHSSSSLYGISNAILMVDKTDESRSNYVQLFMQALIKDMAQIEEEKASTDTENIRKLDKALSSRFLQLAIFFKEYPKIGRECLLTAFSLNPCESLFTCLFPSEGDDVIMSENDPPELSDVKELKFDSGCCKEEDDLQLPSGLYDELLTWIFRPRYKGLFHRWATKEEVKDLCRKLLTESVDVIENQELKFVDVDFDKYKDFKPQYDPDDDGIEIGYNAREYKKLQRETNQTNALMQRVKMEPAAKTMKVRKINGVSSGRAVAPKDSRGNDYVSMPGPEIPNICIKTYPWNLSDNNDISNNLLRCGHSELFSKFIRPFGPQLREDSSLRTLNSQTCLIKLNVLSSFLQQFQNHGASNQPCGEMPSHSLPLAITESVHQSTNQPSSEGGVPEELNVFENNTLWSTMHLGDGFPTDAANEHAFRLVVQQTFAKACIAGTSIFSHSRKRPLENIVGIASPKKIKKEPANKRVKKTANTTEKRPKGRPRKVPIKENVEANGNQNMDKSQYQLQNGDLAQEASNLVKLEESQLNSPDPHEDEGGTVADPIPPVEAVVPCGGFLIKAFYTNTPLRPFTTCNNKEQEFSAQSQQAPTTAATPETTKQGEKRAIDVDPYKEQFQMVVTTVNDFSHPPGGKDISTEIQNRETLSLPVPSKNDAVISESKNQPGPAPSIPDPEIKVSIPTVRKIISSKGGKRRIAVRSQWDESDYKSSTVAILNNDSQSYATNIPQPQSIPSTSAHYPEQQIFSPSTPTTSTDQLIKSEVIADSENNQHFVQQTSTLIPSSSNAIPPASTLLPPKHEKDEPMCVVNDSTKQDQMPSSTAININALIDQGSTYSDNNLSAITKMNDPKCLEEPCKNAEKVPKEAELGSSISNDKSDGEDVSSKCKHNTTIEENGIEQNTAVESTAEISVSNNATDNEKEIMIETRSCKDSDNLSLNVSSSPITDSKDNLNSENTPNLSVERTSSSTSLHDVKEDSVPSPASESCSSTNSETFTKMKSKSSDTKPQSHTINLGLLSKVQQFTNVFSKKSKEKTGTPVPDVRKQSIKEQNKSKDSNKNISNAVTPPESLQSSSGAQEIDLANVERNSKFPKEATQAMDENKSKDILDDNITSTEDVQAEELRTFQDIINEPSNHSLELPNLKELPTESRLTAAENQLVDELIGDCVYSADSSEVKDVICDMVNEVAQDRSKYLLKLLGNIEGVLTKTPDTRKCEEYNMPGNKEQEISTEISADEVMEENASNIGDDGESSLNKYASIINNATSNSPLDDSNFSEAFPDLVEPTCDNPTIHTPTEISVENLENTQDSLIDEDFQTPCSQIFDDDEKSLENEHSGAISEEACDNENFEERACSPEFVNANESFQDDVELVRSGEQQPISHSQCSTSIDAEEFEPKVVEEEPANQIPPSTEISTEEKHIEPKHPISDNCLEESGEIDAAMNICKNEAASESMDANCSQSSVLQNENIDETDQIEVVCLDSDDDELQLPCTSKNSLKDKDFDKYSVSSKDSQTKTLRPVTPVEVLEEMLQTFQRKSIANAKQPKHKYQEIKITVAPSVVQFVEKTGGGLRRLGLCFVSVRRIPEDELPACARNSLKQVKRSSRLRNRNQRLVKSIAKHPSVLQNSNSNDDEEDESSSTTRESSPEIEILEEIPIQKSKTFPRNGLSSRTSPVQRNIAVKRVRMGSPLANNRNKRIRTSATSDTSAAKPRFTVIKQAPPRSSITNRSLDNEQRADTSLKALQECPKSSTSSEDPDFDPSGYISAEDSSNDSYNDDTQQPPIHPQNYPSINVHPTSPEEVMVADDDDSDPLAGVSDYALLDRCREDTTFSTVQQLAETIIDNSASSDEDSSDKGGETLLSDRDGIQTLPDSFMETMRGSERQGEVNVVENTGGKVSYSVAAVDEHQMSETEIEAEERQISNQEVGYGLLNNILLDPTEQSQDSDDDTDRQVEEHQISDEEADDGIRTLPDSFMETVRGQGEVNLVDLYAKAGYSEVAAVDEHQMRDTEIEAEERQISNQDEEVDDEILHTLPDCFIENVRESETCEVAADEHQIKETEIDEEERQISDAEVDDGIHTHPDIFIESIETVRESERQGGEVDIVDNCEEVSYSEVPADEHQYQMMETEMEIEERQIDEEVDAEIQTLPDSFIGTEGGSERQGEVNVVDTGGKVGYSVAAVDEHQMRETEIEAEERQISNQEVGYGLLNNIYLDHPEQPQDSDDDDIQRDTDIQVGEHQISDEEVDDGISTLPDCFIETLRGSERQGEVNIAVTCETVDHSDVATDEHQMRDTEIEAEERQISNQDEEVDDGIHTLSDCFITVRGSDTCEEVGSEVPADEHQMRETEMEIEERQVSDEEVDDGIHTLPDIFVETVRESERQGGEVDIVDNCEEVGYSGVPADETQMRETEMEAEEHQISDEEVDYGLLNNIYLDHTEQSQDSDDDIQSSPELPCLLPEVSEYKRSLYNSDEDPPTLEAEKMN